MKKILLSIFLIVSVFCTAFSQSDRCSLRISLLTCTPGEELYSTFGHTAIRVTDSTRIPVLDIVFNYGSFEFGPDFYSKFIMGKLLYFLGVEDYESFRYQYYMENRSIKEQVMLANCMQKQALFEALMTNSSEENRYYRYDFLFDNCTTRAGNMMIRYSDSPVVFKNILPENIPSFRDQIHSYLDAGRQHWSKLGIDLLLGAKLDRKVSNREAMFLPDYLLKGLDSATAAAIPVVSPAHTIMERPSPFKENSMLTPLPVFSFLLILVLALSFLRSRHAQKALMIFDFLFFFILGLAGLLLLFMWFGTDHELCGNNYNLVWALPSHAIMAFLVHSKKNWAQKYFGIVCAIQALLLLLWFFLPQEMNPALLPLVVLILFRSWRNFKPQGHAGK